jgi:hypothetical protein
MTYHKTSIGTQVRALYPLASPKFTTAHLDYNAVLEQIADSDVEEPKYALLANQSTRMRLTSVLFQDRMGPATRHDQI